MFLVLTTLKEKQQPSKLQAFSSLGPISNAKFSQSKPIFVFPFVFGACTLGQMETSKAAHALFLAPKLCK
jgi:hypothetical protein